MAQLLLVQVARPVLWMSYKPRRSPDLRVAAGQGWSLLAACRRFLQQRMTPTAAPSIAPLLSRQLRRYLSGHSKVQWLNLWVAPGAPMSGFLSSSSLKRLLTITSIARPESLNQGVPQWHPSALIGHTQQYARCPVLSEVGVDADGFLSANYRPLRMCAP